MRTKGDEGVTGGDMSISRQQRIALLVGLFILGLVVAIGPTAKDGLAGASAGQPGNAPVKDTPGKQYPGAVQTGPNQWQLPNGNIYGYSLRHDTSPPLRDIRPVK